MSLQRIKKEIFVELEVLFDIAAVDEMADDMDGYRNKLERIAQIAELLGIKTEIKEITIQIMKTGQESLKLD